MDDLDRQLQRNVRAALERAADDLDPASRERLREARRLALRAAGQRSSPRWRWLALTVPAAAAAVLVAILGDPPARPPGTTVVNAPVEAVRDLDLLTSGENLELLEDLDFYRWLPAESNS